MAPKKKNPGRHVVVIARHWDNPEIKISVTDTLIAVAMSLPEFVNAMAQELGGNGMKDKLASAADTVCRKMKAETSRIM